MAFVGRNNMENSRWTTTDIPATLRAAADYIDDHGWNRGRICSTTGEVCALGGIAAAIGYDFTEPASVQSNYDNAYDFVAPHPAVKWFGNWLADKYGILSHEFGDFSDRHNYAYIYRFNDRHAVDKDHLISAMRQAADDYEQEAANAVA